MESSSFNEVVSLERDPSMFQPPSPLSIPEDFKPSDVSDEAFAAVADDLINDVILEFCFQVHRASKIGYYRNDGNEEMIEHKEKEADIFGQTSYRHNIFCPHCEKKLEASRFANHLEKCMVGNGRQSSRNARRKMDAMGDYDDDENESDSSYSSRKKPKKKTTKGAFRKKVSKDPTVLSIMEASLTQPSSSVSGSDQMSPDSYRIFFTQYCGVKSKHTRKLCMNTLKCSQHTDKMREDIRKEILASCTNEQKVDDVHIDVDTVDEEGGAFYTAPGMSRSSTPEFNSE